MALKGISLAGMLFVLHSAEAQKVSFSWLPNGEADLAGYRVYYGTASRNYTQVLNVGNTNRATVSNLVAGTTYYFALSAYDTVGLESAFTSEIVYSVPIPEPPATLQIRVTSARKTILTLTGPTNRNYDIEASADLKTWSSLGTIGTGATGSAVLTENNPQSRVMRFYRARRV